MSRRLQLDHEGLELQELGETDKFIKSTPDVPIVEEALASEETVRTYELKREARAAQNLSFRLYLAWVAYATIFILVLESSFPISASHYWEETTVASWTDVGNTIMELFESIVPGVTKGLEVPQNIAPDDRRFYFFSHGVCVEGRCFPYGDAGFIAKYLAYQAAEARGGENKEHLARVWEDKFALAYEKVTSEAAWRGKTPREVRHVIESIGNSKQSHRGAVLATYIAVLVTFFAGLAYRLQFIEKKEDGIIAGFGAITILGGFVSIGASLDPLDYDDNLLLKRNGIRTHRGKQFIFVILLAFACVPHVVAMFRYMITMAKLSGKPSVGSLPPGYSS